jgi:hypothetical protein
LIDAIAEHDPPLLENFKAVIPTLIFEIKERTGMVRNRAAVTMAKMARLTNLKEEIRRLHGMELLMSLQNVLLK